MMPRSRSPGSLLLAALAVVTTAECAPARTQERPAEELLALTGLSVWDGTGAPARPGTTILVAGDTVAALFPDGARPIPPGTRVLDLAGHFAIPGLMDTHVHLATDPSGADSLAAATVRLEATLRGGVTTVRDMAGDARMLAWLAREAALREIPSPDIRFSALVAGPDFYDDPRVLAATRGVEAGSAPWARAVDGDTDMRDLVDGARGTGATGLKVYADLGADALGPLVAEAHRQGMPVWAHAALFPARPSELVAAGVDVLSHVLLLVWEPAARLPDHRERYAADYATAPVDDPAIDALLEAMARRGAVLEPTLHVSCRELDDARCRWASSVTARAHEAGVPLAAGTDRMIDDGEGRLPNLHRELALLVQEAGLGPAEALATATSVAARVLGLEDTHGVLAPGRAADVVVLERDPLADIRHTTSVAWVVKDGVPYEGSGRGR